MTRDVDQSPFRSARSVCHARTWIRRAPHRQQWLCLRGCQFLATA